MGSGSSRRRGWVSRPVARELQPPGGQDEADPDAGVCVAFGGLVTVPDSPYELRAAGAAWWAWAWETEQAKRWDGGALYAVARRARLEDDLAALELVDEFDVESFMAEDPVEATRKLQWMLETLKASASGMLQLAKEMRELETQLGLGPKAMHGLGWKADEKPKGSKLDELRARRESKSGSASA